MKMVDKPKKQKRTVENTANLCPHCEGVRTFTSQFYVSEHIKHSHKDKRRSLI